MPTQFLVSATLPSTPPSFRSSQLLKSAIGIPSTARCRPRSHKFLRKCSPETEHLYTGLLSRSTHILQRLDRLDVVLPQKPTRASQRNVLILVASGRPSVAADQTVTSLHDAPQMPPVSPPIRLPPNILSPPSPSAPSQRAHNRTPQIRWITAPASHDALLRPLELLQDRSTPLNHVPARW